MAFADVSFKLSQEVINYENKIKFSRLNWKNKGLHSKSRLLLNFLFLSIPTQSPQGLYCNKQNTNNYHIMMNITFYLVSAV